MRCLLVLLVCFLGSAVADRGVQPLTIVEHLDVVDDSALGVGNRREYGLITVRGVGPSARRSGIWAEVSRGWEFSHSPAGRPRRARRYLHLPRPDHVLPPGRARSRGRRAAPGLRPRSAGLPGRGAGSVVPSVRLRGSGPRHGDPTAGARAVGVAADDAAGHDHPLPVRHLPASVAPGHRQRLGDPGHRQVLTHQGLQRRSARRDNFARGSAARPVSWRSAEPDQARPSHSAASNSGWTTGPCSSTAKS